jgi:hypothetical protein
MALVGGLFWFVTGAGLDVGELDAPHYMAMAESISDGLGPIVPFGDAWRPVNADAAVTLRHFPTGYPTVASLLISAGLDTIEAFRWLNLVLLAVGTGVWYWLSRSMGNRSVASVVVTGIATCLVLPYALRPHSEVFYWLILPIVLYLLWRWAARPRTWVLATASIIAAAAIWVRLVSIALLGAVLLSAIILAGSGRRVRAGLTVALTGGVLGLLIMFLDTGGLPRQIVWHPMTFTDARELLTTISAWVAPQQLPEFLAWAGAALVIVLFVLLLRSSGADRPEPRDWIPGVSSALAHVGVIAVSGFLLDSGDTFTVRLMLPVVGSLLFVGAAINGKWSVSDSADDIRPRRALTVLAGFALVAAMAGVTGEMLDVRAGEVGFYSEEFRQADSIRYVAQQTDVPVYSNAPDALFVAGRPGVWAIPAISNPMTTLDNPALEEERAVMRAAILEDGGLIVVVADSRPGLVDAIPSDLATCAIIGDLAATVLASPDHPDCG